MIWTTEDHHGVESFPATPSGTRITTIIFPSHEPSWIAIDSEGEMWVAPLLASGDPMGEELVPLGETGRGRLSIRDSFTPEV
jgi:hypothetical protein